MIDIIRNFEQAAQGLDKPSLLCFGVFAAFAGLVIWLAGLKLRTILLVLISAAVAGVIAYHFSDKSIPISTVAATVAAAAGFGLERVFFGDSLIWRFVLALFFSVLGSIVSFAGMILLLTYKGSAPVDTIASRPAYFLTVFLAMAAFGALEQLFLCRRPKAAPKKSVAKSPSEG